MQISRPRRRQAARRRALGSGTRCPPRDCFFAARRALFFGYVRCCLSRNVRLYPHEPPHWPPCSLRRTRNTCRRCHGLARSGSWQARTRAGSMVSTDSFGSMQRHHRLQLRSARQILLQRLAASRTAAAKCTAMPGQQMEGRQHWRITGDVRRAAFRACSSLSSLSGIIIISSAASNSTAAIEPAAAEA